MELKYRLVYSTAKTVLPELAQHFNVIDCIKKLQFTRQRDLELIEL